MRLLLLSDIHANLAALRAVLGSARARGFDAALFLGDALGYGPQPAEVLAELRALGPTSVLGNHDLWAVRMTRGEPTGHEHGVVGQALRWQLGRLAPDDLAWVASWPDGRDERLGDPAGPPEALVDARLQHGSPTSLLTYVNSLAHAREAFGTWRGRVAFVGHTHVPAVYATLQAPSGEWIKHQALAEGQKFMLPPGARVILNPGSVGQPRDGDPRAAYGLFDTARRTFEVVRVPYDVAATQAAIAAAGLPDVLGARLGVGK